MQSTLRLSLSLFSQLTNHSGGGAGLIPSHPASTKTEQQWRS